MTQWWPIDIAKPGELDVLRTLITALENSHD